MYSDRHSTKYFHFSPVTIFPCKHTITVRRYPCILVDMMDSEHLELYENLRQPPFYYDCIATFPHRADAEYAISVQQGTNLMGSRIVVVVPIEVRIEPPDEQVTITTNDDLERQSDPYSLQRRLDPWRWEDGELTTSIWGPAGVQGRRVFVGGLP